MFEQLVSRETLRSASAVSASENVNFRIADTRNGSTNVVMRVSGRTTGTIRARLYASFDGGDTYDALIADTGTISAATGVGYLRPAGPLPTRMRIVLTPAGGFDGQVGLVMRTSGLLNFGTNDG